MVPLAAIFAYAEIAGINLQIQTNKDILAHWYWCGVFGELYGGANETRYASDIVDVFNQINGGEQPVPLLFAVVLGEDMMDVGAFIKVGRNIHLIGTHKSEYIGTMANKGLTQDQMRAAISSHKVDYDLLKADDFDGFIIDRAIRLLDRIELAM